MRKRLLLLSVAMVLVASDTSSAEDTLLDGTGKRCRLLFHPNASECPVSTWNYTKRGTRNLSKCRPDYFVTGTRKGGTSALHTYITLHPNVYPFKTNTAHHIGEANDNPGDRNYNRNFRPVPLWQMVGDSAVGRLVEEGGNFFQSHCPGSRLFVLIRDPVERVISNVKMRMRHGKNKAVDQEGQRQALHEAVMKEWQVIVNFMDSHKNIVAEGRTVRKNRKRSAWNIFYEGFYAMHLKRLMDGIDPAQIRIYFTADMLADSASVVRDAWAFLGLAADPTFDWSPVGEEINGANGHVISNAFSPQEYGQFYKLFAPFDAQLRGILNVELPWSQTAARYIAMADYGGRLEGLDG